MLKEVKKIEDFENIDSFIKKILASPYRFIKEYPSHVHQKHLLKKWQSSIESKKNLFLLSEDSACTIDYSAFDSEAFGKKSGILNLFHSVKKSQKESDNLIRKATEWADKNNFSFLQTRIDAQNIIGVRALENNKFNYADIVLRSIFTYEEGITHEIYGIKSKTNVRLAEKKDFGKILNISKKIFKNSRFHKDPNFPDGFAEKIHELWVEKSLNQERGFCFVSEENNSLCGFFTAAFDNEINQHSSDKLIRFELSAVLPMRRASTIWLDLLNAVVRHGYSKGGKFFEGRPQAYNYQILQRQMKVPPKYLKAEMALHRMKDK